MRGILTGVTFQGLEAQKLNGWDMSVPYLLHHLCHRRVLGQLVLDGVHPQADLERC